MDHKHDTGYQSQDEDGDEDTLALVVYPLINDAGEETESDYGVDFRWERILDGKVKLGERVAQELTKLQVHEIKLAMTKALFEGQVCSCKHILAFLCAWMGLKSSSKIEDVSVLRGFLNASQGISKKYLYTSVREHFFTAQVPPFLRDEVFMGPTSRPAYRVLPAGSVEAFLKHNGSELTDDKIDRFIKKGLFVTEKFMKMVKVRLADSRIQRYIENGRVIRPYAVFEATGNFRNTDTEQEEQDLLLAKREFCFSWAKLVKKDLVSAKSAEDNYNKQGGSKRMMVKAIADVFTKGQWPGNELKKDVNAKLSKIAKEAKKQAKKEQDAIEKARTKKRQKQIQGERKAEKTITDTTFDAVTITNNSEKELVKHSSQLAKTPAWWTERPSDAASETVLMAHSAYFHTVGAFVTTKITSPSMRDAPNESTGEIKISCASSAWDSAVEPSLAKNIKKSLSKLPVSDQHPLWKNPFTRMEVYLGQEGNPAHPFIQDLLLTSMANNEGMEYDIRMPLKRISMRLTDATAEQVISRVVQDDEVGFARVMEQSLRGSELSKRPKIKSVVQEMSSVPLDHDSERSFWSMDDARRLMHKGKSGTPRSGAVQLATHPSTAVALTRKGNAARIIFHSLRPQVKDLKLFREARRQKSELTAGTRLIEPESDVEDEPGSDEKKKSRKFKRPTLQREELVVDLKTDSPIMKLWTWEAAVAYVTLKKPQTLHYRCMIGLGQVHDTQELHFGENVLAARLDMKTLLLHVTHARGEAVFAEGKSKLSTSMASDLTFIRETLEGIEAFEPKHTDTLVNYSDRTGEESGIPMIIYRSLMLERDSDQVRNEREIWSVRRLPTPSRANLRVLEAFREGRKTDAVVNMLRWYLWNYMTTYFATKEDLKSWLQDWEASKGASSVALEVSQNLQYAQSQCHNPYWLMMYVPYYPSVMDTESDNGGPSPSSQSAQAWEASVRDEEEEEEEEHTEPSGDLDLEESTFDEEWFRSAADNGIHLSDIQGPMEEYYNPSELVDYVPLNPGRDELAHGPVKELVTMKAFQEWTDSLKNEPDRPVVALEDDPSDPEARNFYEYVEKMSGDGSLAFLELGSDQKRVIMVQEEVDVIGEEEYVLDHIIYAIDHDKALELEEARRLKAQADAEMESRKRGALTVQRLFRNWQARKETANRKKATANRRKATDFRRTNITRNTFMAWKAIQSQSQIVHDTVSKAIKEIHNLRQAQQQVIREYLEGMLERNGISKNILNDNPAFNNIHDDDIGDTDIDHKELARRILRKHFREQVKDKTDDQIVATHFTQNQAARHQTLSEAISQLYALVPYAPSHIPRSKMMFGDHKAHYLLPSDHHILPYEKDLLKHQHPLFDTSASCSLVYWPEPHHQKVWTDRVVHWSVVCTLYLLLKEVDVHEPMLCRNAHRAWLSLVLCQLQKTTPSLSVDRKSEDVMMRRIVACVRKDTKNVHLCDVSGDVSDHEIHISHKALFFGAELTEHSRLCLLLLHKESFQLEDLEHVAFELLGLSREERITLEELDRKVFESYAPQGHMALNTLEKLFPTSVKEVLPDIKSGRLWPQNFEEVTSSETQDLVERLILCQALFYQASNWVSLMPTVCDADYMYSMTQAMTPASTEEMDYQLSQSLHYEMTSVWTSLKEECKDREPHEFAAEKLKSMGVEARQVWDRCMHMTVPASASLYCSEWPILMYVFQEEMGALCQEPFCGINLQHTEAAEKSVQCLRSKTGSSSLMVNLDFPSSQEQLLQFRWYQFWRQWSDAVLATSSWGVQIPPREIVHWIQLHARSLGELAPLPWFVALENVLQTDQKRLDHTVISQVQMSPELNELTRMVHDHCNKSTQNTEAPFVVTPGAMGHQQGPFLLSVRGKKSKLKEVPDPFTLPYKEDAEQLKFKSGYDFVQVINKNETSKEEDKRRLNVVTDPTKAPDLPDAAPANLLESGYQSSDFDEEEEDRKQMIITPVMRRRKVIPEESEEEEEEEDEEDEEDQKGDEYHIPEKGAHEKAYEEKRVAVNEEAVNVARGVLETVLNRVKSSKIPVNIQDPKDGREAGSEPSDSKENERRIEEKEEERLREKQIEHEKEEQRQHEEQERRERERQTKDSMRNTDSFEIPVTFGDDQFVDSQFVVPGHHPVTSATFISLMNHLMHQAKTQVIQQTDLEGWMVQEDLLRPSLPMCSL